MGNPFDDTNYHSYYICVQNCDSPRSEDRVYERSPRGAYGRLPWIYTLNAGISYILPFQGGGNLRVKLAVYNLLNQQRTVQVDQDLQTGIGVDENGNAAMNPTFKLPIGFQSPRYTQLTVSVDF